MDRGCLNVRHAGRIKKKKREGGGTSSLPYIFRMLQHLEKRLHIYHIFLCSYNHELQFQKLKVTEDT